MKKIVLKLELRDGDEKARQKAMTTASGLSGVESVSMDMKEKKLTITGDLDPVKVVAKLRKICQTEILTVGPAKQEEDNINKKKDDNKQQQPPNDQKNKGGGGGGADQKDLPLPPQYYYNYPAPPPNFNHQQQQQPYIMNMNQNNYRSYPSSEEDQYSNSCVIS